jgi:hypothetical protein
MGALLVAFITYFVQPVAAQESRATVRGVVSDPTHAVVPGAKVTLHNTATNVDLVRQADASGFYVFDPVIPGTYSVVVEATGFEKFVQENVVVQTTADVSVNAVLTLGAQTTTVEVTTSVAQVEFNTAAMSTTVQNSFLKDLPILARNPFTLAMMDAGVVNQYWDIAHRLPFYMWSDGEMDIGGPTSTRVEDIVDGVRTDIGGGRGTYNLPMDAVQEVVVQQNIPDAEHGFSGGGAINITSKSGTNDFHGGAYIMTRQPKWNALTNRVTRTPDIVKQNIYGFDVGNPVIKNKLFNFFAMEHWYATQPSSKYQDMPTAAERTGDFSQAIQNNGQMRVIYDPATTVYNPNPAPGQPQVTRTPISCQGKPNVICPGNLDPTAKLIMPYLWYPNSTPDTPDGLNNFKITYPWWTKYHNFSERVDFNASDKLRMYAHYSWFRTRLDNVNWSAGYMNGGAPSIATPSDNGGIMDATGTGIDALYMFNPRTTIDIRMGTNYEEDDYASGWAQVPISLWASLWPNASYPWYQQINNPAVGIYFPNFGFNGIGGQQSYTGYGEWWYDHQREYEPSITVTHEMGKHHMKLGWWYRYEWAQNFELAGPAANWANLFTTNSVDTASSWLGYTPDASGDVWASTLLGVVDTASAEIKPTIDQIHLQMNAFFIQDDFRLSPRTTLNLGLRYEYETGPSDNNHWLIRNLDTSSAIPNWPSTFNLWSPQVLASANLPASASNIPTLVAPLYYGQAVRTTAGNKYMYDAQRFTLLPRIGVAYKLNDKTALRVGYSRFAEAQVSLRSEETYDPSNGYDQQTMGLGPLTGIPRSYLTDPFPQATAYPNPIIPAVGTALGPYQDLGNSWSYWNGLKTPIDDRFNFNIQRQLPGQFRLDATEFLFFGRNAQQYGANYGLTYNINQMNPMYNYQYKGLLGENVTNPFYGVFPTSLAAAGITQVDSTYLANKSGNNLPIMPGTLGTSSTIPLSQLLQPYPQYGSLNVYGWPGQAVHYYGTGISVTRPMSHGIAFLGTYNYSIQNIGGFYDDIATYNRQWQLFDRGLPRHNIRLTGTYQLPFGKGRTFLSSAPKWVDEIVGGWATSDILYWTSGSLDDFSGQMYGGMICDPRQNIPQGQWFNSNCLVTPPAYTPANSPRYYEGLRGPKFWQLDSTAVKNFRISERFNMEFRIEMYNMPNIFIPSNPNVCGPSQCSPINGISNSVASGSTGANYGRELQGQARLTF